MTDETRARVAEVLTWAIAFAFTFAVARFTLGYAYFIGDDFSTMWRFRSLSFGDWLLYPLGGQIVPLQRLSARLVDALAPGNFPFACAVLLGSHLAGVFYLYRILQLLQPSRVNVSLVALYCIHPLLGVQFAWFSPGLTRLPYIALTLVALHAFLGHRTKSSAGYLAIFMAASVGALGFYAKGILTPLLCLALEVVLDVLGRSTAASKQGRKARLACLAVLFAMSVVYVLLARTLVGGPTGRINWDPAFHVVYQHLTWVVGLHAILGRVLEFRTYSPTWVVPLVFGMAIGLSLYLKPRVWVVWVALVLLVSASFGIIGASTRTLTWGGLLAFEHRYHFEVMFIFVICFGIVVHSAENRFHILAATHSWPKDAARAAALVGLVALAIASYREFERSTRIYYADMPRAKAFLTALIGDARALRQSGARFVVADGNFPRYLDWMDMELRRHSQLLSAVGEKVTFGPVQTATHRVNANGHLVRR